MMGQLNLALWSLMRALRALRRPALVLPLFVYAVAQAALLLLLTNFHQPPWVAALAPVIQTLYGEGALHYPVLFIVLPNLFNFMNTFLAGILGAYLWGVGILYVVRHLGDQALGGWGDAGGRYGHLFLSQLPVILFALLVFFAPREFLPFAQELSGNALRAYRYGLLALGILVESLFLFAPVAVLIEGRSAFPAIARGFELWRRNFLAALLIVGLPTLLHVPLSYTYRHASSVVSDFSPETVGFLVVVDIALFLFTNFLVLFAGTTVFIQKREVM